MMPFLINPPKRKARRRKKLFTSAARAAVGLNRPKRKARRKLSSIARANHSTKRRAKRRTSPSPAQLRARKAFAAMARARSTSARKARSAAGHSSNPRRKGGTVAKRRKRTRAATTRRRRRRRPVAANPRRRRRRRVVHRATAINPRRRRRHTRVNARRHHRRYRRNPGIGGSVKGIGGMLVQGLKDGFVVRLGGGLTKYVSAMVPVGTPGSVTQGAVQLVVGTALSMGVKKFMGPRAAAFFLAGAAADVIGAFVPSTIPVVGPILGTGALSAWPAAPRMAAWPAAPARLAGVGEPYTGWDSYDPNLADGVFS